GVIVLRDDGHGQDRALLGDRTQGRAHHGDRCQDGPGHAWPDEAKSHTTPPTRTGAARARFPRAVRRFALACMAVSRTLMRFGEVSPPRRLWRAPGPAPSTHNLRAVPLAPSPGMDRGSSRRARGHRPPVRGARTWGRG